jgi:peptidoglycan hydrolase CwlO-like protein
LRRKLASLVLVAALSSQAAWAESVGHRLNQARSDHGTALQLLQAAQDRLRSSAAELTTAQHLLDRATAEALAARARQEDAQVRVALARDVLTRRIRAIYEAGPATAIDLLLSARTTADFVSIHEFTSRSMEADMQALDEVREGEVQLDRIRSAVEARRSALVQQQQQVSRLMDQMQTDVSQAQTAARNLGRRVRSLEKVKAQLLRAQRQQELRESLMASGIEDEATLLALLGSTGGRTCDIPSGLRDTGRDIEGDASWYGDDFAGQSTASGATFDPSLFTAAHRTLPLGSFLRVWYGGRCAIVLVNDRGPYGNYERVVDLARAPADYLGIGVEYITADVLLPK